MLMEIAQLEGDIAHLYDSIRPYPKQAVSITRHFHCGALQEPVGNGTERQQRLLKNFWSKLFQAKQLRHNLLNRGPIFDSKLQFTIRPFGKLGQ